MATIDVISKVMAVLIENSNEELASELAEFVGKVKCVHASGIVGGEHGIPCCPITGTHDAKGAKTSATHATLHRIREKLLAGGPASTIALGDLLRVAHRQEAWRDIAKQHLYDRMCAWDNQDMPLEDWPEAILKALEGFGVAVEGCQPKVEVRRRVVSVRHHFSKYVNLPVRKVDREDDGSLTAYLDDVRDPEDRK